ncbi:MAG: hypothetical protein EHM20_10645 [Alphaproteobacteria bacterium]|nr:MAG: hypothetical protein EHM20_10645 [Alphaproteobacteria bacterium]
MNFESNNSDGKISSGVTLKQSLLKIINFIFVQLPLWRDDPDRNDEESESLLNAQVSKFLNYKSKEYLPMFCFNHEEPQQGTRTVDLSVSPETKMIIEAKMYKIYDPVLVIECKRLPAPSADREKEYVSSSSPDNISGGIQRFKLGLHGGKHDFAAMIGYMQGSTDGGWMDTINKWIKELAITPIGDGCVWADDEQLSLDEYDLVNRIGKCKSIHRRSDNNKSIEIYHLLLTMRKNFSNTISKLTA